MKFQHITFPGNSHDSRKHRHSPGDKHIAPAFAKVLVMGVLMHDPPVRRTEIFGPLLFDVDERPAPATEFEMLYPGQLEEILFFIGHR